MDVVSEDLATLSVEGSGTVGETQDVASKSPIVIPSFTDISTGVGRSSD